MYLQLNILQIAAIVAALDSKHKDHAEILDSIDRQIQDFELNDRIQIVAEAKAEYNEEGRIEIDDNAILSRSDEGAYVQAWVWMPKEE